MCLINSITIGVSTVNPNKEKIGKIVQGVISIYVVYKRVAFYIKRIGVITVDISTSEGGQRIDKG